MQNRNTTFIGLDGNRIDAIDNTGDQNIIITKTKAKYIYQKMILAPKLSSVWSWGGLAGTCFIAATTTQPRDIFGIKDTGDIIGYLFWTVSIVSTIRFFYSIAKYIKTKDQYSEEAFIEMLMSDDNNSKKKKSKNWRKNN